MPMVIPTKGNLKMGKSMARGFINILAVGFTRVHLKRAFAMGRGFLLPPVGIVTRVFLSKARKRILASIVLKMETDTREL